MIDAKEVIRNGEEFLRIDIPLKDLLTKVTIDEILNRSTKQRIIPADFTGEDAVNNKTTIREILDRIQSGRRRYSPKWIVLAHIKFQDDLIITVPVKKGAFVKQLKNGDFRFDSGCKAWIDETMDTIHIL